MTDAARELTRAELARASLSPMQELVCLLGPEAVHDAFTPEERRVLRRCIKLWATPLRRLPDLPAPKLNPGYGRWTGQWPLPPGPWSTCIEIGGRGSGKSTTAANWILECAEELPGEQLAVVAPTKGDLWGTCVEHPHTGLLAWERPHFPLDVQPSKSRIVCRANGAIIRLLSAEKPERLRVANNLAKVWVEELGACNRPEKSWEVLKYSCRAGPRPQVLFTTNPKKGLKLIKDLMTSPTSAVVQSNSLQNPNLPTAFLHDTILPTLGTSASRETIFGEQLEDDPNALFHREWMRRISPAEIAQLRFRRIGLALDPAETSKRTADNSGIIGAGVTEDGLGIVLADGTAVVAEGAQKPTPGQVARRVVELYWQLEASFVVIDVVRNGETARDLVLGAARELAAERGDPRLSAVRVICKGGHKTKETLAIPVATKLYERGLVRHAVGLDLLEDEMCEWTPAVSASDWSPDRMDACCAVLTELMLRDVPKQAGLNGGAVRGRRI